MLWIFLIGVTSFIIGWLDWITGRELSFFVFFFIPVGMAAWHLGTIGMLADSILCAVLWYAADYLAGHTYSAHHIAVWNTMIRLIAFLAIGWSISRIRGLLRSEKEKGEMLYRAMAEVKILEGILPICAQCKKIRDTDGHWEQLETYITHHTNAAFTHGLCLECARALLEDAGIPPNSGGGLTKTTRAVD